MAWRTAKSLQRLESEIKRLHPGTTVWDIGDEAHQGSWSDHNPNAADVVCAIDVLGDGGLDLAEFVDHLIANPHPNLRYVIYNHRIYQRRNDFRAQVYRGTNAHKTHAHVSVGNGPDGRSTSGYDSTKSWGLTDLGSPKPSKPATPQTPSKGGPDWLQEAIMSMPTLKRAAKGRDVKRLQGLLHANGYTSSRIDGDFGPKTERDVGRFQVARNTRNSVSNGRGDGIVGRYTWTDLLGA